MADMYESQTTLSTSILSSATSSSFLSTVTSEAEAKIQALLASQDTYSFNPSNSEVRIRNDSTINGVMIGLLSSFGSAVLIALIFLVVYFFRYTSSGRILLDRIGRPGEYDDEQAFLNQERDALEEMDDIQRQEYLRAKGMLSWSHERFLETNGSL